MKQQINQESFKDISPQFSSSLHGKLSENELNDRVAALSASLNPRFGEKFRNGIRELWANFGHRTSVAIDVINSTFPAWELSKMGFNIFRAWDCSLQLVTDEPRRALSGIFGVSESQVTEVLSDLSLSLCDLVMALGTQSGRLVTAFRVQQSGDAFVTEVRFNGFGSCTDRGEVVIAVSESEIYRVFSAPTINIGCIANSVSELFFYIFSFYS
jgi:hypothetical protein